MLLMLLWGLDPRAAAGAALERQETGKEQLLPSVCLSLPPAERTTWESRRGMRFAEVTCCRQLRETGIHP